MFELVRWVEAYPFFQVRKRENSFMDYARISWTWPPITVFYGEDEGKDIRSDARLVGIESMLASRAGMGVQDAFKISGIERHNPDLNYFIAAPMFTT